MFRSKFSHCFEVNLSSSVRHIKQEVFCKCTILDICQDLFHCLLCFCCNDLRSCDVVTVFSCVGDRVSHSLESRLIDQVYDQFHFMDTFEICISRVISSFAKSFETSLHKCNNTTTENCLLTEEVCFCFCTECCFKKTSSCSTNSKTICKCSVKRFSCIVLFYCNQTRSSFSSLIFASYCMSRSFWCDHSNIYVLWWNDTSKMNVETMSEHQHVTLFKVWLDVFFVHICLFFIIDQNHDDICLFCSLCCCIYFKALLFGSLPGLTSFIQTNNDIAA